MCLNFLLVHSGATNPPTVQHQKTLACVLTDKSLSIYTAISEILASNRSDSRYLKISTLGKISTYFNIYNVLGNVSSLDLTSGKGSRCLYNSLKVKKALDFILYTVFLPFERKEETQDQLQKMIQSYQPAKNPVKWPGFPS